RAAKASGEKSVEMVHVSEINTLTGYVRGGCSPMGMKKQYQTFLDSSCLSLESVVVSAGRIGAQVELSPQDLLRLTRGTTAELIKEP
ncbi:MAG: Cys-tRNA(Pro) deacylase, partial [Oscillospiraceae bacterium]|nr:Cys-tRNA(Pro) deacylase [Oscillospiraceae bacterium]